MYKYYCTILKYILPILFTAYLGFISLFTHSHVVNGVTIVHSHPYDQDNQHNHTTSGFQLIYLLSDLNIADGAVSVQLLTVCLVVIYQLLLKKQDFLYRSSIRGVISLRAPPSLI